MSRAQKKLKCNPGNFQCGGRCMSVKKNCRKDASANETKVLNIVTLAIKSIEKLPTPLDKLPETMERLPKVTSAITPNRKDLIEKVTPDEVKSVLDSYEEEWAIGDSEAAKISRAFKEGNNFDREVAKALKDYTAEGYIEINEFLRDRTINRGIYNSQNGKIERINISNDSPEIKEIAAKVVALDNAYKELKDLEDDTIVYRGLGGTSSNKLEDIMALKPGDTFKDPGYISTTPKRSLAKTFMEDEPQILMEINLKGGNPNAKDIKLLNAYGESEILLNRDLELEVESIEDTIINGGPARIIRLREKNPPNNTTTTLNQIGSTTFIKKKKITEFFDINQELDEDKYIGGGAYGQVYESNDPNIVIKKGIIGEDEVRIANKLKDIGYQNSPKIVAVGDRKIAMEKISGLPLKRVAKDKQQLIKSKVLEAAKQLGELGISHNDLHWGNFIYNEDEDKVYIIDYGLAEDKETNFGDGPNTDSNLRRNIIRDGVSALTAVKDTEKLESLWAFIKSKYGFDVNSIDELKKKLNTNGFEKLMNDESIFKEIFEFIYK